MMECKQGNKRNLRCCPFSFPLSGMQASPDTIAAPATASGEAALSLIRVSGPAVPDLLAPLYGNLTPQPRTAQLISYRNQKGQILDKLLSIYFPEGHSFTGEPVLELTPHGNPFLVRRILDDLIARGCRLAEPGEFTRRAFLNGRLDLSQAEAIPQIIRARSDRALLSAQRQLSGSVGRTVDDMVQRLLQATAQLEAYIDFPEEDLPPEEAGGPAAELASLHTAMEQLIATRRYSRLLHDGVKCVLLGEPNVGKSSLLNALMGEDRALVSATPGTTRDYIEDRIHIGPYLLRVIDTAGLHHATNDLEEQGIARTLRQMEQADLLLVVLDASRPRPTLPQTVHQALNAHQTIVLENKSDLATNPELADFAPERPHLRLSASTGQGIPELRQKIRSAMESGLLIPDEEAVLVSARHAEALAEARNAVQSARSLLAGAAPTELAASELHAAIHALGAITGKIDNERMLDQLFAGFCIGK